MKKFSTAVTVLLTLFICSSSELLRSKEKPPFSDVIIQGAHERLLTSSLQDQEYKLWISLPKNYDDSKQDYPVIYLLDAQWDFTMLVSIYGQLNYDGDIPDAILVGVTWGGESPDFDKLRGRDFTPTKLKDWENSGGADQFLRIWRQELIPFVKQEYRVNDQRILIGSSLGGLFTTYAMLTQPDLFTGYLPTATSAWWDKQVINSLVKKIASKKNRDSIKMYSAAGEFDGVLPSFKELEAEFQKTRPEYLDFKFEIFNGLGHSGIKAIGNTRGLQYLFTKNVIQLNQNQLNALVGKYKDSNGIVVTVLEEHGELSIIKPDGAKESFSANSPKDFHRVGSNINIQFSKVGSATKMTVKTFDAMYEFIRAD